MRRRAAWTKSSLAYLEQVQEVVDGLRPYWPLTLRQTYYRLVAELVIPNNKGQYKKLGEIMTRARLDGHIPWAALEDRNRAVQTFGGFPDTESFVEQETKYFLTGYRRDLQLGQPRHIEVWVEKDALSSVIEPVCDEFCVPMVICKGYGSISLLNEARNRFEEREQSTRILYFGDLDPSGVHMLPAMMETLQSEMDVGNISAIRCALTPEQVDAYNMPVSLDAIKPGDPRTPGYLAEYGDLAVELDAFSPPDLQAVVRDAIEASMNMRMFKMQQRKERADLKELKRKRQEVIEAL